MGQLCLLHSLTQRSPANPGLSSAMLPSILSWDCCLQESSTWHTEVCVALTWTLLDNCLLAAIFPPAFAKVGYQIVSVYEDSCKVGWFCGDAYMWALHDIINLIIFFVCKHNFKTINIGCNLVQCLFTIMTWVSMVLSEKPYA